MTADLYGITGFFREGTQHMSVAQFGGFFTKLKNGRILGDLVDPYGPSQIRGWLRERSLEFDKSCDNRQFKYRFTRQQDGVWVGAYEGVTSPRLQGDAVCKIRVDWKNIQRIDP